MLIYSTTDVLNHYNTLEEVPENTSLDFRLAGNMPHLDLTEAEQAAIVAFLGTLTGVEVYTAEKWSNPFDEEGNISVIPEGANSTSDLESSFNFEVFPNPVVDQLNIKLKQGLYQLMVFDAKGAVVKSALIQAEHQEDLSQLPNGIFIIQVIDMATSKTYARKIVKE